MKANELQVGGAHYRAEYQHWDLVADTGMGYFEGQVTKYVVRWRKKNGVEDLKKALHYLNKLIELRTEMRFPVRGNYSFSSKFIDQFRRQHALDPTELLILQTLTSYRTTEELFPLRNSLEIYTKEMEKEVLAPGRT